MSHIKKRGYVMVTKGENQNRVAQVIDYLHDKSTIAIMVNYNGYIRFVSSDKIRLATPEEKKKRQKTTQSRTPTNASPKIIFK